MTRGREDYLEAIALLTETDGHAHVAEIAKRLGIKNPTVTVALRALADQQLIRYEAYRPVELTPRGIELAEQVIIKHQTLKHFLTDCLTLSEAHADELACKLEHGLDDIAFRRLYEFMNLCTLDALPPGEVVTIVRISQQLDRKALASAGIVRGASIKRLPGDDGENMEIQAGEKSVRFALKDAKEITVKRSAAH